MPPEHGTMPAFEILDMMVRNGAQGRNRTSDTAIFSRMLYQLSYLGIFARPVRDHLRKSASYRCRIRPCPAAITSLRQMRRGGLVVPTGRGRHVAHPFVPRPDGAVIG
jgi:hypothetical protein